MNYVLSCESAADLTREQLFRRGISFINYPFSLNGVWYRDDLGMTIPYERFYQVMKEGAETGTAQINASEFESYFEPFLKESLCKSRRAGLARFAELELGVIMQPALALAGPVMTTWALTRAGDITPK